MRTVISYTEKCGKVIKSESTGRKLGAYPADEKPFHQRVIDAYYRLECEQKPLGIKNKTFVRDVHRRALEAGF